MRRSRKLLLIAGVVLVAVFAAILFVVTNVDWIVKTAIERYGSAAAGTAVRVRKVTIRLASGEGAIAGLTVANPPGFSDPSLFRLGAVRVRIDPRSVAADPVVIDEIRISAPRVFYEVDRTGTSNLDVLKRNLERHSPGKTAAREQRTAGTQKEKRIRIRKFVLESGRIDVRVAAAGKTPHSATLKRLELKDIGGPRGTSPEEAARRILSALAGEAGREVASSGARRYLSEGTDRSLKRLWGK